MEGEPVTAMIPAPMAAAAATTVTAVVPIQSANGGKNMGCESSHRAYSGGTGPGGAVGDGGQYRFDPGESPFEIEFQGSGEERYM